MPTGLILDIILLDNGHVGKIYLSNKVWECYPQDAADALIQVWYDNESDKVWLSSYLAYDGFPIWERDFTHATQIKQSDFDECEQALLNCLAEVNAV